MADAATKYWHSMQCYKGYLPAKEALAAQSFVVLACRIGQSASLTRRFYEPSVEQKEVCATSHSPDTATDGETHTSDAMPRVLAAEASAEAVRHAADIAAPSSFSLNTSIASSSRNEDDDELGRLRERWNDHVSSCLPASAAKGVGFYLFRKRDVIPPPLKFTLGSTKVSQCFFACERVRCTCDAPHLRPGAWRLRLDTLKHASVLVNDNGQNRRLAAGEVVPTAGYYFALGLHVTHIVQAVMPTMCRFNKECKHGPSCLFIHADVCPVSRFTHTAAVALRRSEVALHMDVLQDETEKTRFFDFLEDEGILTVGDVQVLGVVAFESLASRVPRGWAEAFLAATVVRNIDPKMPLASLLVTFPRVRPPVKLPAALGTVSDVLHLPAAQLLQLDLAPHVVDACEMIRTRFEVDDEYKVITLCKEPAGSFYLTVTRIIVNFRPTHAHCSWRKHDPTRPVVTSLFTYVDVQRCACIGGGGGGGAVVNGAAQPDACDATSIADDAALPQEGGVLGVPSGSWCTCPRHWVIAVNYELSTPSGSRCSEQNAMGKLASMGLPTWAVREVFVHGTHPKKEVNPLFPCGVCENMLQKVTRDVQAHYGGDVTLYMFDAAQPRKVVHLPIPEISHRDGSSFKRFVAHDLRAN